MAARITIINVIPFSPTVVVRSFTTAVATLTNGQWLESEKVVHNAGFTTTADGFTITFNGQTVVFTVDDTLRDTAEATVRADIKGNGDKIKKITPKEGPSYWQYTARQTLPIQSNNGHWTVRPQLQWTTDPRIDATARPSLTWMVCPQSSRLSIAPVQF